MPVQNRRSTAVTNINNGIALDCRIGYSVVYQWRGDDLTVNSDGTVDSAGSTYRICEVPLDLMLSEILISNTPMPGGTIDLGFYKTIRDGGSVIDRVAINNNFPISSVQEKVHCMSLIYHSTVDEGQPIWKVLFPSLTSRDSLKYSTVDFVATLDTPSSGQGGMSFLVMGTLPA